MTIVTQNHLPFASVFAQSLTQHHPEAEICIWLLDDVEGPPAVGKIRFRNVSEAFLPDELAALRIYYNVFELATSVKPRLIQAQLDEGAVRVIYMDSDIAVFRPMEEVFSLLDHGASAVFTPHITRPLPQDGRLPGDLDILTAGTFNLGFLAVAALPEVLDFLSWWDKWLKTHCFSDKSQGVFTDQKWAQLGSSFMKNSKVLDDPSYNVAYWNLHYRTLAGSETGWLVNGRKLCFFHFSGFNPRTPTVLSQHQNRIEALPEPLARLLAWYSQKIRSARIETTTRTAHSEVQFSNGVQVDPFVRQLFQKLIRQGENFIAPLSADGAFYQWLLRPANRYDQTPVITNYLKGVYDLRPELQQAFPDLLDQHRQLFLKWIKTSGGAELGLSKTLVSGISETARPSAMASQPKSSRQIINYWGYLRSRLGLGEAARGNITGLRAAGFEVNHIDVSHLSNSEVGEWNHLSGLEQNNFHAAKINLIHVNPEQLTLAVRTTGTPLRGRYNIGIWAWETLKFPEKWLDQFALLDEIWVGGSFMGKALAEVSPIPVIHVPHVVEIKPSQPDRGRFGLPAGETIFLFMFDFFSTTIRKNPGAVIQAFRKAFRADEPVRLVIKSMNGFHRPEELDHLRELAQGLNVTLLDQGLSGEDRATLMMSCDVFVSLHRAEGFGLCIAEAMAMGKPVIATGWSGNMDFMNINNSLPVRFTLHEMKEGAHPYPAGTLWAEPDLDHAAELMRKLWLDQDLAKKLGARAKQDIEQNFSLTAVGEKMVVRLDPVNQRLKAKPGASGNGSAQAAALMNAARQFSMDSDYRLLKKFCRGQVDWHDFLDHLGGYKDASAFAARLPLYWAARTTKRFKTSLAKRMMK